MRNYDGYLRHGYTFEIENQSVACRIKTAVYETVLGA